MSVFMRRMGRLRFAYPVLLRFGSDNSNYPRRVLGAPLHREHNTRSAALNDLTKAERLDFVAANKNDVDDVAQHPEKIRENDFAHNLFLNSRKYASIVMQPNKTYACVTNEEALEILNRDWSLMTGAETVSAVKKLSYNIRHNADKKVKSIEPLKYMRAFDTLNMKKLTDDELMTMMYHLVPFNGKSPVKKFDFYSNLCTRIDRECMLRSLRLSTDKTLYLCDIIYQMTPFTPKPYSSQFIWYSIRYLGNKPQKLNPQHLIQIMFFLNIYRKPPINMYELEYRLEQCVDDLSINELAIAALGFFKTRTQIRSTDFLNRIIQRTIAEIDVVNTVSIAAIVKLVRFSMHLTETSPLLVLLKALTPYEPRYTLMTLAHIAQACGRIAVHNKMFISRIIGRLNKELKTARLKDLERLLYTFCILNINSSIYENVVEELKDTWDTTRACEIEKYPYAASRILGYLATQNVFPMDLMKRIMAPEYVSKTCRSNYFPREYLVLNNSLLLEAPSYDGPFLKSDLKLLLEKKDDEIFRKTGLEKSNRGNLLFSDVLETCQKLFNTTTDISAIRPLPHFMTQDIVFCLNEQNQLVPSEHFLSQFEPNEIKYVNKEKSNNVKWIVLVIGHHGLIIRNLRGSFPTGPLAAKMRQLSIIGYTPIMISHISWDAQKSPEKKRDYIQELVSR